MKIKEILRNKWGWAGAVIGIIYLVYNLTMCTIACSSIINKLSSIYTFLPFAIPFVGFILGLILQKLWRKFK